MLNHKIVEEILKHEMKGTFTDECRCVDCQMDEVWDPDDGIELDWDLELQEEYDL